MNKRLSLARWCYGLFLFSISLSFFLNLPTDWLQTDLRALLPEEKAWTPVQLQADKIQENRNSQQVIALIGQPDPNQAEKTLEAITALWQQSQLFGVVESRVQPDLSKLKQDIKELRLALLPLSIREQLSQQPVQYFQQYAEDLINPFNHQNLLSLPEDWLGLGRFVLNMTQGLGRIQWNSSNGLLYIEENGITWYVLRAELKQGSLIDPNEQILGLMAESEQLASTQQAQWYATGASLFAANAKLQAQQESMLMTILGISLTLLLLLSVFRSLRALWLFLPIILGMCVGIIATIFTFGHIHILTLVVGTSLVGVLVDFPLHWLVSSFQGRQWQGQSAMSRLQFSFLISLIITLLGYILLGFTPLPVLQQTAVFSSAALIFAMLTTLLYLPILIPNALAKMPLSAHRLQSVFKRKTLIFTTALLGMIALFGIVQSQWRDDIRQWVALPDSLLNQAKQIAKLTDIDLGTQYFLVVAENDDQLLHRNHLLSEQLQKLLIQGKIQRFQSLSQWIMDNQQQQHFIQQLATISSENYQILQQIGIPLEIISEEIKILKNSTVLSLQAALNTELGRAWQGLYLGQLNTHQVASIVKVSGIQDLDLLANLADNQQIFWQDKPSHLNQLFEQTRNQTAWLKLLSFVLAGFMLWRLFGLKQGIILLAIPLIAILLTIGILGWIGLPISLFAMFGLLLVSAIGIDYTAFMKTAQEPLLIKNLAVLLAACTTLISFILLALSSTPAVASFGLSVSIGVGISAWLTLLFFNWVETKS